MIKEPKTINFKYIESDNSIDLGVPEDILVENGIDYVGCNLKFNTSESSIGLKKPFSLYLLPEDINEISRKVWEGYVKTEPERAKKDIDVFIDFLKGLE